MLFKKLCEMLTKLMVSYWTSASVMHYLFTKYGRVNGHTLLFLVICFNLTLLFLLGFWSDFNYIYNRYIERDGKNVTKKKN